MLLVILFAGLESASASGNVGVHSGLVTEYTYGFSGTIRDSNGTLLSSLPFYVENTEINTIQNVSGTNVTFRCIRDMLNGTNTMGQYWIDVSTGNGTAWLVVIAPDLAAGDMVYPNWLSANHTTAGAYRINETVQLMYGDSIMEVSHMQRMFSNENQTNFYNYDYYWEQSTGLLVKCDLTYLGIDDDGVMNTLVTHLQRVGLQNVFYPLIDSTEYPVTVDSNSAILGFVFNQTEQNMILNVRGPVGTNGYCGVTFPASLLNGSLALKLDGHRLVKGTDYTETSDATNYVFNINYFHGTDNIIEIAVSDGTPETPETPETPVTPETPEAETPEAPLITTEVAIIIAVAVLCIVGVVSFWALKKRK